LFLRLGILTLVLPVGYLWEHAPFRRKLSAWSPLEELGRSSLFVYWVHVEMVYGFFSGSIRRDLSLEGAVLAYVLFTVFLLLLVRLKNWIVEWRAIYLTDSKSVI
jgi:fucose 4-O-acetylase-like acetyltransferase